MSTDQVDDDLWRALATLNGELDEVAVERLVAHLAARGPDGVIAFADALAEAVHALDTPAHAGQPVRDVSEPQDVPALPMSDDVFLLARLAVVATGPEAYARVLADPGQLAGTWRLAEAEDLLGVCERAYEHVSDHAWDHEPPVSMETGSNAAWGDAEGEARWMWVMGGAGWDLGVVQRPVYQWAFHATLELVDADPTWQAWWAHAAAENLELYPFFTLERSEPDRVRKGRRVVTVERSIGGAVFAEATREELPALAANHMCAMLEMARDRLRLPPLPPLPPLDPIPSDIPDTAPEDEDVAFASQLAIALEDADPATVAATLAELLGDVDITLTTRDPQSP